MYDNIIANHKYKIKYGEKEITREYVAWFRDLKGIKEDSKFIIKDKDYSFKRKLYWLVKTPGYNAARYLATHNTVKDYFSKKTKDTSGKIH